MLLGSQPLKTVSVVEIMAESFNLTIFILSMMPLSKGSLPFYCGLLVIDGNYLNFLRDTCKHLF